jgi:hypothetical protein
LAPGMGVDTNQRIGRGTGVSFQATQGLALSVLNNARVLLKNNSGAGPSVFGEKVRCHGRKIPNC